MYGRRLDPATRADPLFLISAILMFAWLLSAIGEISAGTMTYFLLTAATGFVAAAVYRQWR